MSGKEAYEKIKEINPDIKVLFASGYSSDYIVAKNIFGHELNIIAKPSLPKDILRMVREVLEKQPEPEQQQEKNTVH
jgi:DNA-binding NtrC family response regulator